jgi:hypothetical protein
MAPRNQSAGFEKILSMNKIEQRSENLSCAIERVYQTFRKYVRPAEIKFCTFCYEPDEIKSFLETPLSEMNSEIRKTLAWETSDHWDSLDVYKHYLPVILDRLSPPNQADGLYPEHLFESLYKHKFQHWEQSEREAVLHLFSTAVTQLNDANDESSVAWIIAALDFIKRCDEGQASS